jgi:predicted N-formylglutamate amidohydrolase
MPKHTEGRLLSSDDPAPVMANAPAGESALLLCCDHAGNLVPRRLGSLGLGADDMEDHIAIDVGVHAMCVWLAHLLGAPLIAQPYSRLVIDCNRRPGGVGSIPAVSDGRVVPANETLSPEARAAREEEVFRPYHDALAALIQDRRAALGRYPVLCAMHSFARVLGGKRRTCDIGVIHGPDNLVGDLVFEALSAATDLVVGRNVPYEIDFAEDQTIPHHVGETGMPYVEIEVCQDLLATCGQQRRMATLLAPVFRRVDQGYRQENGFQP